MLPLPGAGVLPEVLVRGAAGCARDWRPGLGGLVAAVASAVGALHLGPGSDGLVAVFPSSLLNGACSVASEAG